MKLLGLTECGSNIEIRLWKITKYYLAETFLKTKRVVGNPLLYSLKRMYKITVTLVGDMADQMNTPQETEDYSNLFRHTIELIYRDTEVLPIIGDWIEPLSTEGLICDMGEVKGRDFFPGSKRINYEIG